MCLIKGTAVCVLN